MAGTFEVRTDVLWSASSWHFYWVLSVIAEQVGPGDLQSMLWEIDDENLGWFSLEELTEDDRRLVEDIVRERLLPIVEARLDTEDPAGDWLLGHVKKLVAAVRDT